MVTYLVSHESCSPARLHWGKSGWPDFGCWNGAELYRNTWCDFGCAVRALDPEDKFTDLATDRYSIRSGIHSDGGGDILRLDGIGTEPIWTGAAQMTVTIPRWRDAAAVSFQSAVPERVRVLHSTRTDEQTPDSPILYRVPIPRTERSIHVNTESVVPALSSQRHRKSLEESVIQQQYKIYRSLLALLLCLHTADRRFGEDQGFPSDLCPSDMHNAQKRLAT